MAQPRNVQHYKEQHMKAIDRYQQQYDADREVNEFLHKYGASASLSRDKRYYKRVPIRYQAWLDDNCPIPFEQEVEMEPMVEINLPREHFRKLVEREADYQDLIRINQESANILFQQRADEKVRKENPAVEQAYRRYQMLLELARQ